MPLIDAQTEFLIVRHSYLNGNSYDPAKVVEAGKSLEPHFNGRKAVTCLEGDIIQVEETGEVVLTHQSFWRLSSAKYARLRDDKIAASLGAVLDKYDLFRQQNPQERLILCLEPKSITSTATIDKVVNELKARKITDAYFDSFFNRPLENIQEANFGAGTNYQTSLHLIFQLGSAGVCIDLEHPKGGVDLVTVPYPVSFGQPKVPHIYGAVGSEAILDRISQEPSCLGAYVRLREGRSKPGSLAMLWNSMTNTKHWRRSELSMFM